jgi:hypothetical protein
MRKIIIYFIYIYQFIASISKSGLTWAIWDAIHRTFWSLISGEIFFITISKKVIYNEIRFNKLIKILIWNSSRMFFDLISFFIYYSLVIVISIERTHILCGLICIWVIERIISWNLYTWILNILIIENTLWATTWWLSA